MFRTVRNRKKLQEQIRIVSESPYFDRDWYLDTNPDVMALHKDPAEHYLKHGWTEGRNPGPKFSTTEYIKNHPQCQVCPLLFEYYLNNLEQKTQANEYELVAKSEYFDSKWYLRQYPDIKIAKIDPLKHYLEFGWIEGRTPSQYFNAENYPELYRLAKSKDINPLLYYELHKKSIKLPKQKQKIKSVINDLYNDCINRYKKRATDYFKKISTPKCNLKKCKNLIDNVTVVSFDLFDTLLFRKTNTPEIIFDLIGRHFGIHEFRTIRMNAQNNASQLLYEKYKYPHANLDEIYEELKKNKQYKVNWDNVKKFEIQIERDALSANQEMIDILLYAKQKKKRVIITTDMYIPQKVLRSILKSNGVTGFNCIYCSADERKAKFNGELFKYVIKQEKVKPSQILHIGDNENGDVKIPEKLGITTFLYSKNSEASKFANTDDSEIDKGLYKLLYDKSKGFWYNLGVEVGGPLYMGLYLWLLSHLRSQERKVYFLARDGYNLFYIFQRLEIKNIEYLYTSRRALLLAGMNELTEEELQLLPPYTTGQTIGEIFDYLCINKQKVKHLEDAGFHSLNDVISKSTDIVKFKKIYQLNKELVLKRCAIERQNAINYFNKLGFFSQDNFVFDCGWNGSSQLLLERFLKIAGYNNKNSFLYCGIFNSDRSRRQLYGKDYQAYLFDFYKNQVLQQSAKAAPVMYELFFSAPHESVKYYDKSDVVLDEGRGCPEKNDILSGILDYITLGSEFATKYQISYDPSEATGHLRRLIQLPTNTEAITIGNLSNVDGFANVKGFEKKIAHVTMKQLRQVKNIEIYWPQGLLKRNDVSFFVKKKVARRLGIKFPDIRQSKYHLEDKTSIKIYDKYLKNLKESMPVQLNYRPKISVIIPVYNVKTDQLKECINSVLEQTYNNFELILVDDHSTMASVVPTLQKYEIYENVIPVYRPVNGHISAATNDGINLSSGEFIAFMDCDDTIDRNALYEVVKKLNENPKLDFIYTDEDKVTEDGKIYHMPFFKPDWSPDLFMSMMYTNHLGVYRASIVKAIGGLRSEYNGAQDYDLTLRFLEKSDNSRVGHVSKVLYHWRERKESVAFAASSKNYAFEKAKLAKESALERQHIPATMEYIDGTSQYRPIYHVVGNPLVSIIIPSKDHPDILFRCIDSIAEKTSYPNYEIIIVDNGSSKEHKKIIQKYVKERKIQYLYGQYDFNFSKMNNIGVEHSNGEYLLFLNDDIEIIQKDWLSRLLGQAQQSHTGAVGAKLYYPQTTLLQHAGISNLHNGPSHSFNKLEDSALYYFCFNKVDCNCIAVTAACLLVSKKNFISIGGFNEDLAVAYNDVALCFALHEKGYYNVIRNDVIAYHHESLSRGLDSVSAEKQERLKREKLKLDELFPQLCAKDPYLNPNLSYYGNRLSLTNIAINIPRPKEKTTIYDDYQQIEKSKYFNKKWYLKTYVDVAAAKADPVAHYLNFGWTEGRNPSKEFNTMEYITKYPDLVTQNINPLLHYERTAPEKIFSGIPSPKEDIVIYDDYQQIKKSVYFDKDWYLKKYPDVAAANVDPITHYLHSGWKEGRNPSKQFNTIVYLEKFPELRASNTNPLLHYERTGEQKMQNSSTQMSNEISSLINNLKFELDNLQKDKQNLQRQIDTLKEAIRKNTDNTTFIQNSNIVQSFLLNSSSIDSLIYFRNSRVLFIINAKKLRDIPQKYVSFLNNFFTKMNVLNERFEYGILDVSSTLYKEHKSLLKKDIVALKYSRKLGMVNRVKLLYRNEKLYLENEYLGTENYPKSEELTWNNFIEEVREGITVADFLIDKSRYERLTILKDMFSELFKKYQSSDYRDKVSGELLDSHLNNIIVNKDGYYFVDRDVISSHEIDKSAVIWRANLLPHENNYLIRHFELKDYKAEYELNHPLKQKASKGITIAEQKNKPLLDKYFSFEVTKPIYKDDIKIRVSEDIFQKEIREAINTEWYKRTYQDCKESPIVHYMTQGWLIGHNPSPDFDGNQYLKDNPDVKKAGMNPLEHYVLYGKKEGRKVTPVLQDKA
ncbi:MAG: glycosyltransferase [Alphaproteobacteria bacterium]|nr:glycosyltransferase [Alphaproteobacteria bacterium]